MRNQQSGSTWQNSSDKVDNYRLHKKSKLPKRFIIQDFCYKLVPFIQLNIFERNVIFHLNFIRVCKYV